MKPKSVFILLFIITFGIILFSCASTPQELTPEHKNIIGTKWLTIVPNSTDSFEFVNNSFCIFTSKGKPQRLIYKVQGDKITIGNNLLTYVLKEDTLYLVGYPADTKVKT